MSSLPEVEGHPEQPLHWGGKFETWHSESIVQTRWDQEQLTRSRAGVTQFAPEIVLGGFACQIKISVLDLPVLASE